MAANTEMKNKYLETQGATASKEEICLMLYDGAVRFLRTALNELVRKNNIPEKARAVKKAVDIIDHLKACLDMEQGGDIAFRLDSLYEYMLLQLTEANMKNDSQKIEAVVSLLLTLREGWSRIYDTNKSAQTSALSSPPSAFSVQRSAISGQQAIVSPAATAQPQTRFAVKV